jgi:hypothetical protein
VAIVVILATAGADIEQFAGNLGVEQLARILVFQLDQAALGAAVAERFPLVSRHLVKPLGTPKGLILFAHALRLTKELTDLAL